MLCNVSANVSGKIRKTTLHGREYLVAPVTMIVPGVLNGSKGPLYYPPEEIAKDYQAWNSMPIVVYHPQAKGNGVSARTPDVLEKQGVGTVFNTTFNGRLRAEAWFDVARTQQVNRSLLSRIKRGERIVLSTGLFTDNEPASNGANFNGKAYSYVARNYRPDHLAILPDMVGACSIADGCGVLNAYNPNQPRDAEGKFGSGGGKGKTTGKISKHQMFEWPKATAEFHGVEGTESGDYVIAPAYELTHGELSEITTPDGVVMTGSNSFHPSEQAAKEHLAKLDERAGKVNNADKGKGKPMATDKSKEVPEDEDTEEEEASYDGEDEADEEGDEEEADDVEATDDEDGEEEPAKNFNPSQPRDAQGRFGSGGGGGTSMAPDKGGDFGGGSSKLSKMEAVRRAFGRKNIDPTTLSETDYQAAKEVTSGPVDVKLSSGKIGQKGYKAERQELTLKNLKVARGKQGTHVADAFDADGNHVTTATRLLGGRWVGELPVDNAYNPNQPRDSKGRFGSGGGSAGKGKGSSKALGAARAGAGRKSEDEEKMEARLKEQLGYVPEKIEERTSPTGEQMVRVYQQASDDPEHQMFEDFTPAGWSDISGTKPKSTGTPIAKNTKPLGKKATIQQAGEALEAKGYKLGKGETDLKTKTTSYLVEGHGK